ncbi:MAG: alpha/beta hydrolase-fold protein [Lentisphaerales bacterium]|nr:alpha/beta hydrolase-fold protein [Lentisphaerales bacterium]
MYYVFVILFTFSLSLSSQIKSVGDIHKALQKGKVNSTESEQIIAYLKKRYKNQSLKTFNRRVLTQRHEDGGGTVVWSLEAKSGHTVEIFAEKNRHWSMQELGKSGVYVASQRFPNFSSVHFRYAINGVRQNMAKEHRFGFESYKWQPMSLKQSGVPEGKLISKGVYKASDEFYKASERNWLIYVPVQYKKDTAAKLLLFNDGGGFIKGDGNACTVMDNLIHTGKMPVSIAVFVNPGNISRGEGKAAIKNRGNEYDTCTPKFANFIEKEILSQVYAEYNISKDPADHVIIGSSSGASCAFTAAWHRNDLFQKVVSFVGSYCDFRPTNDYPHSTAPKSEYGPFKTAHDYPALIRKTVPSKKIKVYLQDGVNDLDNRLGNWYQNNERMATALAFAGYDFKFTSGKGLHSKKHGMYLLPEILEWLWKD